LFSDKDPSEKISWRDYQKNNRRRGRPAKIFKLMIAVLALTAAGYGVLYGAQSFISSVHMPSIQLPWKAAGLPGFNTGKDQAAVLDAKYFLNLRQPAFSAQLDGRQFQVETSIDQRLQGALLSEVETTTAREHYRSRYIGIVVMKPETGRVLAMVSFDSRDPSHNACVSGQFPAASIFKIVTASAAIDRHGLTAASPIDYTGRKHTLYKGQLKETAKRYTNTMTLEESFAQSINPVFGKIGAGMLGRQEMEDFGRRFGFNQPIRFDIPVEPSRLVVADDPYELAEVASGFNKQTTLTPLHGAMIGSAVLNGGRMKPPTIVERITGPSGRTVYERKDLPAESVISEKASRELYKMMLATVSSGTARRIFRSAHRDAVLKELNIGGKTGSMNNNPKYDWFVGFAENPRTRDAVVVAAVVAHEDYIGERAGQYARMAMSYYFSRPPAPAK
jgi:cell division protein FtsI/penicillin-binding protein 2